jgi:ankyrin repeat protein
MLTALVETDPGIARRDEVLLAAVESGNHDLVRWLLSMGGNANARATDQSRQTALHNAAWRGDFDMARLLVETGADLQSRDDEHNATPRGWAETSARITGTPHCMDVAAWLERQGG